MEKIVQFPKLGLEFIFTNSFHIGPFNIALYGITIAFGMTLALVYAFKNFKRFGIDGDKAIDAIIAGIVAGVIGGRLYYVLFNLENYPISFDNASAFFSSVVKIFATWEGGMAIYGGIIGSLTVGILVARWRKIKILPLLDVVGIGFLIGQSIGRWGNFFNVEAFGSNTTLPWGMTSPTVVEYLIGQKSQLAAIGVTVDPYMPVHPTFLYESLWCALGFILLHLYSKHRKFDGEVFLMYVGYYGLGRVFIEGLRTDSLMLYNIRISQLLAGVTVIAAISLIVVIRKKRGLILNGKDN